VVSLIEVRKWTHNGLFVHFLDEEQAGNGRSQVGSKFPNKLLLP